MNNIKWLLNLLLFQFLFFADDDGGGGGDDGDLLDLDGDDNDSDDNDNDSNDDAPPGDDDPDDIKESIYGELEVKWPDNTPDEIKNDPMYKPFVDKEGNVNVANLLKSYGQTKKSFGSKVAVPSEHATEEEWADFYEKVAKLPKELDKYSVDKPEGSQLSDEDFNALKAELHKAKVPASKATELIAHLEKQSLDAHNSMVKKAGEKLKEEQEALKEEWGEAYKPNLKRASSLIKELGDADFKKYVKDSGLISDVKFVKFLVKMADEMGSESTPPEGGGGNGPGFMTPAQASVKINEIRGDGNHPYNNKNHPGHEDAVKEVMRLYQLKNPKK